jgi:cell division protein FtsI/penicillin-binding protein 2
MAEIEEKEYLIGLIVKDPKKNGNGGGDVAAPIFSKILNTIEKF